MRSRQHHMLENNDSTLQYLGIFKMLRRSSFRTNKTKVGLFLQTAPVLWRADAGSDISTLFVDTDYLLLATSDAKGRFSIIPFLFISNEWKYTFCKDEIKYIRVAVITLDLLGKVHRTQQLPVPVGRFLRNGRLMYAWCPAKYGFQKWKGALFGNHSFLRA